MKPLRDTLIELYLVWLNNYLSIELFAEHNGLTTAQADVLIDLARWVYNSPHPDA